MLQAILSRFLFLIVTSHGTFAAAQNAIAEIERMPKTLNIPGNNPEAASNLLNTLFNAHASISSLQYVSVRNEPKDPIHARLLYRESGNRFFYDFTSINVPRNDDLRQMAGFDGERGYVFSPKTKILKMRNNPPPLDILRTLDSPLIAFQFVKTGMHHLQLVDLQSDSKVMAGLIPRSIFQGVKEYKGKDYILMRIVNGFDDELNEAVTYDVYLDKQAGFYPMIWKAYDTDGVLIKEFEVVTLKNVLDGSGTPKFTYPATATLWQSKWRGKIKGPDGPIKYFGFKRAMNFPEVSVVSGDLDEAFKIDPVIADLIYDEETGVTIPIPK